MAPQPTFFICSQSGGLSSAVERVLDAVTAPTNGSAIFIKPNFTYPREKPGVTTTRSFLVALIEGLLERGARRICLGEGDGGYNAFSMAEAFRAFRLEDLRSRYGIEYLNVNDWPSRDFVAESRGQTYIARFPAPLFDEFDSYISAPVPKVHCMTSVSGAVKNQWGLIQDPMRLRLHCVLNELLFEIVQALNQSFAISDGTYGLTRNGPMVDGISIPLGWVSGSNCLWLHDLMMCRLMGVPVSRVKHLRYAVVRGAAPLIGESILSPGWDRFVDNRFYLNRNVWNRIAKLTWYSPALNRLVYTSRVSGILHRAMYSVREKSPDLLVKGVDWD